MWPDLIKKSITLLAQVSTIISFDIVQWPGFGCLVEMKYANKLYLRTILPLLFGLLMYLPVLVLTFKKYLLDKTNGEREQKIATKNALLETRSYFWNNILTW